MESHSSDLSVLRRSESDPDAFSPLVERHHAAVFAYAARRIGRQIAEDITAETFAIAFRRRGDFSSDHTDARPWLMGIATNLMHRHRRAEMRALRAYARHGVPAHLDPQPDDGLGARLAAVLSSLRPRQRDALLLYALADLTYDEIALAMDIPVGTVRSLLNRARSRAARELRGNGDVPRDPGADPSRDSDRG